MSDRDDAKNQDQMRDQEAFREDPRQGQEVSGQQPETQPSEDGEGRTGGGGAEDSPEQSGREDGGEATGNPPNAG